MSKKLDDLAEFWRVDHEDMFQLDHMGIKKAEFVDFSQVELLDKTTDEYFWKYCFMSGRPMKLRGTIALRSLPAGFALTLFCNVGLMAAPDIAQSFKELVGDQVQLFPVTYHDDPERFFYINMMKMFDCVDFERSGAEYNSKGRPYSIKKLVLRKAAIDPHVDIFTMTFLTGTVIIRDRLRRELLKRHDIRGSVFTPLEVT
jgi:hypothetical protein